jgi:hypothetical protein
MADRRSFALHIVRRTRLPWRRSRSPPRRIRSSFRRHPCR